MRHLILLFAFLGLVSFVTPATAQDLRSLHITAGGAKTSLSLEQLDAFAQSQFETTTIWTDGAIQFSGVALQDILASIDAAGQTIELVALNDYKVSMPMAEITPTAPMVATRMNGETMPIRDKGPFWIVYPYDSDTAFKSELIYARSVWQLNRINVLD